MPMKLILASTAVSSVNKTKILLKVALNIITLTLTLLGPLSIISVN